MTNKKTFVLQSDLTQKIDNLVSYFENEISKGGMKIDKLDIKEFEGLIEDEDILVRSELHYLRDFMNLEKVDMIHLDSLIERLIKEYESVDPVIFSLNEVTFKDDLSIYKVWQKIDNSDDICDVAIVVAEDSEEAKQISPFKKLNSNYPDSDYINLNALDPNGNEYPPHFYCEKRRGTKYLGSASFNAVKGVLLVSFNVLNGDDILGS